MKTPRFPLKVLVLGVIVITSVFLYYTLNKNPTPNTIEESLIKHTLDYIFDVNTLPDFEHVLEYQGEPIIISKKLLDYEIHGLSHKVRYVDKDALIGYAKKRQKDSGMTQFFYLEFNEFEINDNNKAHIELSLSYILLYSTDPIRVEEGQLNIQYLVFSIEEGKPSITHTRVGIS